MNSNWTYVPFSDLFMWGSKSIIKSGQGKTIGCYKMFICSDTDIKYYDKPIEVKESLVFGTGGKPSCHYVNEPFAYSTDCAVAQSKSDINVKFYYYFFRQKRMKLLQDTFSGSGLQHTSKKKIDTLMVPKIKREEQDYIVSKIEELLSQLDSGVELLEKTKEQLKIYKQAVLKDAYEGRLTEKWRKDHIFASAQKDYEEIAVYNPVYKDTAGDENEMKLSLPETWIKLRIGDVFDVEVGSTPSRKVQAYWNGKIKWVSSGEVCFNKIYDTEECITEEGLLHSSTRVQPIGTIMLAMIGEGKTRGQAAILEVPAAHNQNTAAIQVSKTPCCPQYVYYYMQMNYENTRRVGSGNNQKALNKERVRALRFPFASFEEQRIIVEAIESRLSVCDSIEQTVDAALLQAEATRQSILQDAFEGR